MRSRHLASAPGPLRASSRSWAGVEPLTWAAIDWREFHHFCLTYDGPSRGGTRILLSTSTATSSGRRECALDTAPEGTAMRLGTDATYDRPLTGALDEAYIYASALDASAVAVLYGSVSAAPTVTPVPTSHLFEGSLVAYYPFVDGTTQDAHHTWNGYPESMTTTEGRDGSTAIVLDADHGDPSRFPGRWCKTSTATPTEPSVSGRALTSGTAVPVPYGGSSDQDRTRRRCKRPTSRRSRRPRRRRYASRGSPRLRPSYVPSRALRHAGRQCQGRRDHPTHGSTPCGRCDATAATAQARRTDRTLCVLWPARGTAEGDLVIIAGPTLDRPVSLGRTIDWRDFITSVSRTTARAAASRRGPSTSTATNSGRRL